MVIDANIILRHLLADHAELSPRADLLLESVRIGDQPGFLLDAVLAECVYVLEGKPNIDRFSIASQLLLIYGYKGLIGENIDRSKRSLELYAASNLSFVDALIVCTAVDRGIQVMTFDGDLAKRAARLMKPIG